MSNTGKSFFDERLIEEIRGAVDIVEVIGEAVTLRRQGRNHIGLCPFHTEKTPSFSVSPDKQMYYCFGCGAGGSVFSFLQQREGLSFPEAVRKLSERAGIKLPEPELGPQEAQRRTELERLAQVVELASAQFQRWLWSDAGRAARAYLVNRGFSDDTIKEFQLGWAPAGWDGLITVLGKRGVSPEWLVRAGLAAKAEDARRVYDRFRERVIFPIWDARGRTVAFGGRLLPGAADDRAPKYLNSPETELWVKGRSLYPWHLARTAIREQGRAVVVEGYVDVMTCYQAGFKNTVASLGTAFTAQQGRLLLAQSQQVLVAYDADLAGQGAAERGIDILAGMGADVRMVRLPDGKDPDEYISRHGAPAFAETLDTAIDYVEHRFRLAQGAAEARFGFGDPRTAAAVVAAIAPTLLALESPVARESYVNRFARVLGESEASLWAELRRAAKKAPAAASGGVAGAVAAVPEAKHIPSSSRDNKGSSGSRLLPPAVRLAQEQLLAIMLAEPARISELSRQLDPGEFPSQACQVIVQALFEAAAATESGAAAVGSAGDARASGPMPLQAPALVRWLVSALEDSGQQEAAALVGKLLMEAAGPASVGGLDRVCRDCVRTLQEHSLGNRIIEVRQEVQQLEREGKAVPAELLGEYTRLVRAAKRNPPAGP